MLTNQSLPKPIRVLLGPELFYENNPMGVNMGHLIAFQRTICPPGMFRFDYVAFCRSGKFGTDQAALVKRLQDAGIPLSAWFTTPKTDFDKAQEGLRELMFQCDMVFPTEVLKHFHVEPLLRHRYDGTRAGFVHALCCQSETTAEWNPDQFRQFARSHQSAHVGPKSYRRQNV